MEIPSTFPKFQFHISGNEMAPSSKKIILASILAALSVAIGYLFLYIPNVEMITATVFISGVLTGPLLGLCIGLTAETLYSVFNPYGMPILPLLLAQVFCFGLIGWSGGVLRRKIITCDWKCVLFSGAAGFVLTLVYDVLTTMSFIIVTFKLSLNKIVAVFSTGMLFYLTHIGVNTLLFIIVVPVIISRLVPHLPDYLQIVDKK